MKKAFILSIAALLMAAPLTQAQAQSRMDHRPQAHSQWHKSGPESTSKRQHAKADRHWKKGQRMSDWRKHASVRDYRRHGLHKPGHGQRWVKVDNQYVLLGIASGVIAAIVAAR
ncbi:RcnB family protein [Hoeflea olei]|uniref:Transmembrane signal peptide protein n=1 Tax=Hoeflea olei TaxID=1480615 RepID=A0A1C1Z0N0_9HYPH|nr:RcnB family protein [Hoeflea olei]OCW59305.1 hypothetical protein AWJ14_09665 [Hoeflea olei]